MHVIKICGNYKYDNSINCNNSSISYNRPQFNSNVIKNSDSLCFTGNPIKSYKIGESIENLGLVLKELSVRNSETHNDEECYLLFKNSENGGSFRLMKKIPEKLKELSEALRAHPDIGEDMGNVSYSIFTPVLEKAKAIAPQIKELFDELTIAEITYTNITKPSDIEKVTSLGYKRINPEDDIIAIQNFLLKQKEYAHASTDIAIPILRALMQNNKKNIIIKANAFGENSASPVHLYLRYGFKPVNTTITEIESHQIPTKRGLRIDPKYNVVMSLPEDAILYKLLRNNPMLDEINKASPCWFNRNN